MKRLLDFFFRKRKQNVINKRLHKQFMQVQQWIAEM